MPHLPKISPTNFHLHISDSRLICTLYPLRCAKYKRRKSGTHSKVVKFDHFQIGVMYHFLCAKKFNSIAVSHPVCNHSIRLVTLVPCQIRQRNVIISIDWNYCYIRILNKYFRHAIWSRWYSNTNLRIISLTTVILSWSFSTLLRPPYFCRKSGASFTKKRNVGSRTIILQR